MYGNIIYNAKHRTIIRYNTKISMVLQLFLKK